MNKLKSKLIIAVMLIIGATAFMSCEGEGVINEIDDSTNTVNLSPNKDLIDITLDNIGDLHNYLLAELANDSVLMSNNTTFGDVLADMETILVNSDVYSTQSNINTGIITSLQDVVDLFSDIKLDEDFLANFEPMFRNYITNHAYLDEAITTTILNSMDYHKSINTDSINSTMIGYTSVLIGNNIYAASNQYWTGYFPSKSVMKDPDADTLVWVDLAGGVLGASCS